MMARCHNPRHENFNHYGARGIAVCVRWQRFENFLADMGEPPTGKVLDRVDIYGDYCPQNCRWASFKQSTQNRSNTVWVGSSRVAEIAERFGIRPQNIYQRLVAGWTLKEIIQHPGPVPHGYDRHGKAICANKRSKR